MQLLFLGTGTSVGIPVIGCDCRVCRSPDRRDRRLRSSLYVVASGVHIVIDTATDFRQQVLDWNVPRVDAVLITHSHADHIFGLDDVRRFNTMQNGLIPVYASVRTVADLERIFDYVFRPAMPGTFRPRLEFKPVVAPFEIGPVRVHPIPVSHGAAETFGFRVESEGRAIGYFPDCHVMPEDTIARLKGMDIMILDALRQTPHSTHMSIAESVDALRRIGARQSFLTHMCHNVEHAETGASLPPGIALSYDGLRIEI